MLSMTPQERRLPHVIDGSRRKRIAAGSGTTVEQVNQLLAARKQMAKMMKQIGKGKMPALPGAAAGEWACTHVRDQAEEEQAQEEDHGGNRLAVKLRLTRVGSKKNPVYRVVAADSRSPRDGKFIEIVGPLQPADRPVDDRARRGEGQGLAVEGRAAVGHGRSAC